MMNFESICSRLDQARSSVLSVSFRQMVAVGVIEVALLNFKPDEDIVAIYDSD